ncbi:class I SAM-dependent RNA methyltransferase [Epibacterium sp. MM17-32]|uniref:THUMP domain-containing class I SAM-dependent RNA methyltransferase n=1 Tax=Epibacterium sp. MM17-32 TaxID=2917734 RepID=UPI001EF7150C|nr:class I SAM-dependent RNA methyltransferase [Epibacterium sp. MM17-32]MCG7628912.1 class I SAM-dependent RNA methyltransferase [Epibacterium sp. MM17-32]
MTSDAPFEIFLIAPPGLETPLCQEARAAGFANPRQVPGGVAFEGTWQDVYRANLYLRGATRVLARIGSFRAFHLAQLDKRARKFPWGEVLRPDVPVRVEVVTNRKSKIYHAGAATQRIETAITEELGAPIAGEGDQAEPVTVKVRIDDNTCIFSVDTSGEGLHKRGHKVAVGKAPMRETLAALMLRACGYDGQEPVLDPMCGSGTFVIEAAEIARGLAPGRGRPFAFERLANFDADVWQALKAQLPAPRHSELRHHGSDRNAGAVEMATQNAERAGVSDLCRFGHAAMSDLERPEGPTGLVIVNPPYGARIGNKKQLYAVYGALGEVLKTRFSGWRVGLVTSDTQLARATGLPFLPLGAPIAHGGLKVRLFRTDPLP